MNRSRDDDVDDDGMDEIESSGYLSLCFNIILLSSHEYEKMKVASTEYGSKEMYRQRASECRIFSHLVSVS